jgi:hypothetical protein
MRRSGQPSTTLFFNGASGHCLRWPEAAPEGKESGDWERMKDEIEG